MNMKEIKTLVDFLDLLVSGPEGDLLRLWIEAHRVWDQEPPGFLQYSDHVLLRAWRVRLIRRYLFTTISGFPIFRTHWGLIIRLRNRREKRHPVFASEKIYKPPRWLFISLRSRRMHLWEAADYIPYGQRPDFEPLTPSGTMLPFEGMN